MLFIFFGCTFLVWEILRHNCDPVVTKVQISYSALQMHFWVALKLLFANWRFSCKHLIAESKARISRNDSPNSSSRQNGEHKYIKTVSFKCWNVLFSRILLPVIAFMPRDIEYERIQNTASNLCCSPTAFDYWALSKFATWNDIFESISWQIFASFVVENG